MKPLTAEWVRKAEEDFVAVVQLAIPNLVCFHCQQCGEKYLKARLQESGIAFPKTHDLEQLLDLALVIEPLWDSWREDLSRLTDYASEFRDPGEDAGAAEAKRALKTCRAIRATVRTSLGLEPPAGSQQEWRLREKKATYRVRRKRK